MQQLAKGRWSQDTSAQEPVSTAYRMRNADTPPPLQAPAIGQLNSHLKLENENVHI